MCKSGKSVEEEGCSKHNCHFAHVSRTPERKGIFYSHPHCLIRASLLGLFFIVASIGNRVANASNDAETASLTAASAVGSSCLSATSDA